MKKIGILLILLMFLICTVVGFKAAETYYRLQPTPTATVERKEDQLQQTLFLLHVDQLKAQKPALQSVWALFLYYSSKPSMTFVPLYQRETGLGRSLPLRAFSISREGDVSEAFLQTLQSHFDLNTTEFVVLDDQALRSFGRVFTVQQPQGQEAVTSEQAAVTSMCSFLQTAAAQNGVDLPWKEVLPNHFRTNVRFDLFLANWLLLTAGENRPQCEMISRN